MTDQTDNSNHESHGPKSWPERNVNLIIWVLVIACAATVVAQFMFGTVFDPLFDEKHPAHFSLEEFPAFQAIFGFVAFVVIVFLGRILRLFVMRKEDYYDS